ncbi:WXG100 family type VII secretion target [Microbacterium testaceum]|uniref:WXG100 family type VII secretion target n=1 Tax=Microbacterium TaxID=33882 RepID=UPI001AE6647E|nr:MULTISPECIES: WXG100 family type VII secretion target [Microbacterium]MDQ1113858.1 WXG100 family type VII secretion target [Microbacterium testaceum]MDR6099036.1 WXG100 family type VII secretion target [Microbacterium sp. SORGH_AS_0454]
MIEHLEVTPLRLSTTAQNIKAAGAQIDALLETLTREAATLSTQWSGDAQQAYARAQAQFGERLVSRTALLARLSGALDDLATAYSEADLAGARGLGATA